MTRIKSNYKVQPNDRKDNKDNNHATSLTMTIVITTAIIIEISFNSATTNKK